MNLAPYLRRWLRHHHPVDARTALVALCRDYGDVSLTKPLLIAMQNEKALVLAIPDITYIEDERKLAFLLDRIQIEKLRSPAIRALGWLGDPTALSTIMDYLEGNEQDVIIALANIGGEQSRDLLVSLLGRYGENIDNLKTIVRALDYVGDPVAAPYLVSLIHELRPYVTAEAVRVLGNLRNPVVIPDLIAKLDDPRDPDQGRTHGHSMSYLATRALEAIGTPEALAAIQQQRST